MAGTKLFIGNLSFDTNDESLEQAFGEHGKVVSAKVITDRDTGRSRGFGFVEYETAEETQAALKAMDGTEVDGRPVRVNEAQDKRG